MDELSVLDLQNLRHLIGGYETSHKKMMEYASGASDPQIKQFFQKNNGCRHTGRHQWRINTIW